jgi:hypothetical protein
VRARIVLVSALLAGCSADDPPAGADASRLDGGFVPDAGYDATVDPESACGALAHVRCAKLDACTNGIGVARDFGSVAECVARTDLWCRESLRVMHGTADEDSARACTAALGPADCHDVVYELVEPCVFRGTLTGVPFPTCVFDAQCATGRCTGACGSCAERFGNSGSGEMCAGHLSRWCFEDLFCVGIRGKGSVGTCERMVAEVGAECDPAAHELPPCDPRRGLVCNGTTARCEVMGIREPGAMCPSSRSGLFDEVVCRGGGSCAGECTPNARDGSACSPPTGLPENPCVWPAECVREGDGAHRCVVPTSVECG